MPDLGLSRVRMLRALLLVLLGGLASMQSLAQDAAGPATLPSIELLEDRLQEAEASADSGGPNQDKLIEYFRKSISLSELWRDYDARTAKFVETRESAPKRSAELRQTLEKLESRAAPKLPDSLTRKPLQQIEQQLLGEKADLTGLSTALAELETSIETQSQRAQLARDRLTEAKKRQAEITDALQTPVPEGQTPRLAEARRWALEFETGALGAEIEMLDQELLSQPMRTELLGAQRDKATLESSRQQQYVELLEALVAERRRSDAETAREKAEESEREAFGKHPLVQEIAQENTLLGEQLNQLAAALEQVAREENVVTAQAKRIADSFRLARQKLEIAGLSEALGEVLLEQRRGLPDAADFKAAQQRREQLVIESSLRQIRNQQERASLRDINLYVEASTAGLSDTWRSLLRLEILQLAEQRRELLDKAIAADDSYLQALGELDFAQRQLSETVAAYNDYLDERLLWVRTGDPPSLETIGSITRMLGIFVSSAHWLELLQALFWPPDFPWILLLGVALFALLLRIRERLYKSLQRSGNNVGQLRHDRYVATLRALLLTLLLALPWPVLFTATGLHLQVVQVDTGFSLETQFLESATWNGQFVPAIGAAFYRVSLYLFYFIAFRILCAPGGLANVHFGWSTRTCTELSQHTKRLMSVFIPAGFLLVASISYDPAALAGGMGRLSFMIVMLSLAWFFARVLAPRKGLLRDFYATSPANPITWLRHLWLALGLSLPVALSLLAAVGYVYTAAQFGSRVIDTLWLLVAIILIHQLVVRWVLLTERRLVFRDALERHRAQRAAREALQEGGDMGEASAAEEPEVDFGALSEDTKKLISTALTVVAALGLWAIWSDVLPAFRILDEVSLWSYVASTDGIEETVPVTLGDAILGLLIIAVGIAAARRLPALMEIVFLARLNISAGSRYAITTLTQYTIYAVGVIMVFNILGGRWSEIQWLVAALGVGIGFGLQEIVANFISGLILLFERPIRIGDVVTVGDTSGVVTRIRIRSTTIRNWDQKELVVPNKEFITGRLLNWTLSDPMARIVIPVGIAYGSDVARALELVREAAVAHERVVDEPEPLVIFESFGDNALTITLRCCIASMDFRLQTLSELNLDINRRFEEAGIVIAFPQRDIHLDTSSPLEIRLRQETPAPG